MTDEKTAARLLESIEAVYVPTHDYVPASLDRFRHLDRRFYEGVQRELQDEGFRHLHDLEDLTLTKAPGVMMPVMVRALASGDGSIMAAAYHPKLKLLWRVIFTLLRKNPPPVIDFETEHEDGGFTVTSNAAFASMMGLPPMIRAEYLKPGTPLPVVLRRHRERLSSEARAAPRGVHDTEALLASQNRMNALKAAYRNLVGGITREEIDRAFPSGGAGNAAVHRKVVELRGDVAPGEDAVKSAVALATRFTRALIERRYADAARLLHPSIAELGEAGLRECTEELFDDSWPTRGDAEEPLTDWPGRWPGDVAHVYVGTDNENAEAVSVLVTRDGGRFAIREIDWGRP